MTLRKGAQGTDIFFDAAVMSRDALMVRSRRSWCSSNSARKVSNMGMKGDCWASGASIVSDLGRFWPICCGCVVYGFLFVQAKLPAFAVCRELLVVMSLRAKVLAFMCFSLFRIWFQTATCSFSFTDHSGHSFELDMVSQTTLTVCLESRGRTCL